MERGRVCECICLHVHMHACMQMWPGKVSMSVNIHMKGRGQPSVSFFRNGHSCFVLFLHRSLTDYRAP